MTIIASFDIGSPNTAITVAKYNKKRSIIYTNCMINNTIGNLTNKPNIFKKRKFPPFMDSLDLFINEINPFFKKYNPNVIIGERFQNRGIRGGNSLSELASFMLSIITYIGYINNCECYLITASTWKNKFKNDCVSPSLIDIYKEANNYSITPHQVDSALIGIYVGRNNYSFLMNPQKYRNFINNLRDAQN